jgi:hypothetical protein
VADVRSVVLGLLLIRETSSLDCEGCVIILGWWFVGPERQRRRDAA